jgi:hypothetical protein
VLKRDRESSGSQISDFLILYRDFEKEVLQDKDPDDNFQCFNFTDQQFDQLKSKMLLVDSKAITERGFWKEELEILLSIRHEKYGTALRKLLLATIMHRSACNIAKS